MDWVANLGPKEVDYLSLLQPLLSGLYPSLCSDDNEEWFNNSLDTYCRERETVENCDWINRCQIVAIFMSFLCQILRTSPSDVRVPKDSKHYACFVRFLYVACERYASLPPIAKSLFLSSPLPTLMYSAKGGKRGRPPFPLFSSFLFLQFHTHTHTKSVINSLKSLTNSKEIEEGNLCGILKKQVQEFLNEMKRIADEESSRVTVEIVYADEIDGNGDECFLKQIISVILRRRFDIPTEFGERFWNYCTNKKGESHGSLQLLLSN